MLTGCSKYKNSDIAGTWINDMTGSISSHQTWTFSADGKYTCVSELKSGTTTSDEGTYTLNGNNIILKSDKGMEGNNAEYKMNMLDNDKMEWEMVGGSGSIRKFIRQ